MKEIDFNFEQISVDDTMSCNDRAVDLHAYLGFEEVLKNSMEIIIEDKVVRIPSLPSFVLLKLISWSDRPESRDNDLYDILKIIESYYEYESNAIMERHFDLFDKEPFDQLMIAARVLGRGTKQYIQKSEELRDRVLLLLADNLNEPSDSEITRERARIKDAEISYTHALLLEFQTGLTEEA